MLYLIQILVFVSSEVQGSRTSAHVDILKVLFSDTKLLSRRVDLVADICTLLANVWICRNRILCELKRLTLFETVTTVNSGHPQRDGLFHGFEIMTL